MMNRASVFLHAIENRHKLFGVIGEPALFGSGAATFWKT